MSITQRDIAKALGISHSTVSRALRSSPKISDKVRLEIVEAAKKMGYQPNPAAASLARQKRNSRATPVHSAIAWLNAWSAPQDLLGYSEFRQYWEGASETASRHGYHLEEFLIKPEMSGKHLQRILQSRGIEGILIPPHRDSVIDFRSIDWSLFAVIRFGRTISYPAANTVTSHQTNNTILAFEEIEKRGYQRIGFIDDYKENTYHFDAGYLRAQSLRFSENLIPIFRPQRDPAKNQAAFRVWVAKYKPDALISQLPIVPDMLKRIGLEIGQDVAVATNSVSDGRVSAGIYQNSEEIGCVAALSLIAQIQDHQYGIPEVHRETLIGGHWVDGDSVPSLI